jgi:putative transposase
MSSYRLPSTGATFGQFLRGFVQSDSLPFCEVLTATQIEQTAAAENVSFGTGANDTYSVPLTLWAFVAQVLSEQKSCVAAVARVLVLLSIHGRETCYAGSGAYCKARAKLPDRLLQRFTCDVGRQLEDESPDAWHWRGHRVVLVDGSTLSMPDTPANQKAYPQSRSQKAGVGFPLLRWVALLGLATAAVLGAAFGPWRGKETGESALFRTLLDSLREGDVLVADRYYCSYWLVALALARGVQVVFRKHQLRHTDFRTGRRLGHNDHIVTWTKPRRPAWMAQADYDELPATLSLREVRKQVAKPGCRVKELVVVTTLLDSAVYATADILELYHERWHAEIDLRSIKTHMKMEILRCQTPEMVRKEIWAHLLAYNLVRKVMAQAAEKHDMTPRQLSFAGAMQTLNEFRTLLLSVGEERLPELCDAILQAIASHRVGNRPDRWEPRKVKRRPKGYSRMTKSRDEERASCR